ncbi:MAG: hypothetical protein ACK4VN_07420 [Bacteroidales bacterium]
MQISIDINIEQLLVLIRNLPEEQLLKIQHEVSKTLQIKSAASKSDYLEMLLEAPTMSKEQYVEYKQNRNRLNQWRIA